MAVAFEKRFNEVAVKRRKKGKALDNVKVRTLDFSPGRYPGLNFGGRIFFLSPLWKLVGLNLWSPGLQGAYGIRGGGPWSPPFFNWQFFGGGRGQLKWRGGALFFRRLFFGDPSRPGGGFLTPWVGPLVWRGTGFAIARMGAGPLCGKKGGRGKKCGRGAEKKFGAGGKKNWGGTNSGGRKTPFKEESPPQKGRNPKKVP